MPYAEACARLMVGSADPLHDWLAAPRAAPCVYWGESDLPRLRLMGQYDNCARHSDERGEEALCVYPAPRSQ